MTTRQKTKVVVKNNTTGKESSITSYAKPRKKEVGVMAKLGINQFGLDWLENEKGMTLSDINKQVAQIWLQLTGMPEEGIGTIGSFSSDEDRAEWTITVSNPDGSNAYDWGDATAGYSKATVAEKKQREEEPISVDVSVFSRPVAQPIAVVADKTITIDPKVIKSVTKFIEQNKPEAEIKEGLMNKFNDPAMVEAHYEAATKQLTPEQK